MAKVSSESDRAILRQLAEQVAEIAILPDQKETADLWRRLNRLQAVKPMVWINEIPWHEMDVNGELTLQTSDEFCRIQEQQLRQTLYQWRHMRVDMIVEDRFYSPLAIRDTGFGISEDVAIVRTDEASTVVSRQFRPQIQDEEDLGKIKMPEVSHDVQASEETYQRLVDLFGDILPIEKRGVYHPWFAPWDELVRWWGVQEAMVDLVARPELVHQAMDRLVTAYLRELDQYEALNLLSLNNNNVYVGSGGLGYTDELPQPDCDPAHVRPIDLWGDGRAQIFSAVSPAMHEEFSLQYERRWLKRFGLSYYGCCEPLHLKVDVLKSIPSLRKISMSPWINVDTAVQNVGNRYVFSYKPNPAVFVEEVWDPTRIRLDLLRTLEKTRGCSVEVIMKDISTVRYQPQRLWEWAEIAREATAGLA